MKSLNALRGFKDLYPEDKAVQNHIFNTVRSVACSYGFTEYDGPIVEPFDMYADKTSEEILSRQTFEVQRKGEEKERWILRPEMTPTLARMVAARAGELAYPLRWFNIGARFRYEAPQKGRSREFWQCDFDLLGARGVLADAEILSVIVAIYTSLGAGEEDFVIYVNSREEMESELLDIGYTEEQYKDLLALIDRRDKIEEGIFRSELSKIDPDTTKVDSLISFLNDTESDSAYFKELFAILEEMGIRKYIKLNAGITRGLDYYTGLVFEVKEIGSMKRSLLGGGRYDNLVAQYNPHANIPGIGFAFSDVVTMEFLKDKNLVPDTRITSSQVLVTIFSEETVNASLKALTSLRAANIAAELFPDAHKKLDKQLKYADKVGIPYALIIGPDELQKGTVIMKNLAAKTQQEVALSELSQLMSQQ